MLTLWNQEIINNTGEVICPYMYVVPSLSLIHNILQNIPTQFYCTIVHAAEDLTLFGPVDLSILIIWMSLFVIIGVSGENYHLYCILYKNSVSKQF